jgi:CRP/FNR family transcriptional regulator, cyclic AMP receptor protein
MQDFSSLFSKRDAMAGFATLPGVLLAEFARGGSVRVYPKNAIVTNEGDPAEFLYLVIEGTLKVYVSDDAGHEVELNEIGPQQYFGELMLYGLTHNTSVRTVTPAKLCTIGRDEFQRILTERTDLAFIVIQNLIRRVRSLTDSVRSLALMDVYGRVARLLLELAIDAQGRRIVPERLSQQKIAERVGASRGMVNRVMKGLVDGGYITIEDSIIVLHGTPPKHW